jgi:hypothetical protein
VRLLAWQLKWRLTLTCLQVAVTAVLIAAWLAIIAVAICNILSKLYLADRTQAAVYAWREGLVHKEE